MAPVSTGTRETEPLEAGAGEGRGEALRRQRGRVATGPAFVRGLDPRERYRGKPMRIAFPTLLTIACLVASACVPAGDPSTREPSAPVASAPVGLPAGLVDRVKRATVFVQILRRHHLDPSVEDRVSGTGFLISGEGHVVTNWHVVSPLVENPEYPLPMAIAAIEVVLDAGTAEQRMLPARLLAADEDRDLALLAIDVDDAPHLELAPAAEVRETTPVWLAGFPFGPLFSVLQKGPEISINRGHVSSLRRDDRYRLEAIQFDAAVNRGNSGGPLLDSRGRVLGVTNIKMGESRLNLAVPVRDLHALLQRSPPEADHGDDCQVKIESNPPGAAVWVDGERVGETPFVGRLPGGRRDLALVAVGRAIWHDRVPIHDGASWEFDLLPARSTDLVLDGDRETPITSEPFGTAQPRWLFDFEDGDAIRDWRQDTGGDDSRSWYVDDGMLRQFHEDGMLHACFPEVARWLDGAYAARVRIAENDKDGRAGLIFAATGDGFALFRIFTGSDRAQLAYHHHSPFGWQVVAETPLRSPVDHDRWYDLSVHRRGEVIVCSVDGESVLAATYEGLPEGGCGFYSVDARADFDDARLRDLGDGEVADAPAIGLRSFWFNETWNTPAVRWRATAEGEPAAPWPHLGGCAIAAFDDDRVHRMRCERFRLLRAQVHLLCSVTDGEAGLVLGDGVDGEYVIAIDGADGRVVLRHETGGRRLVLAEAGLPEPLQARGEAGLHYLQIGFGADSVEVQVDRRPAFRRPLERSGPGRIGLHARGGALFHTLNVTSPPEPGG